MQSLFGKTGNEIVQITDFNHPGVELENREAVKAIMKIIDELPENQKTAIILKTIDDLKGKEIAEIMSISEKAVESLLSRAKNNLKEKLNSSEGK
jgi:RNA polymerase sigma-70 factor (ECF subfamily)